MSIRIKLLKLPAVLNAKEGVVLSKLNEEAEIDELTHYWQGQIARGAVAIVEAEQQTTKRGRGRNHE